MSVEIFVPRREGQYRVQCACGAVTESQNIFDPNGGDLDKHIYVFTNEHAGRGHAGVLEAWVRGQWVTVMPFAPMTAADWAGLEAMGGLTP